MEGATSSTYIVPGLFAPTHAVEEICSQQIQSVVTHAISYKQARLMIQTHNCRPAPMYCMKL